MMKKVSILLIAVISFILFIPNVNAEKTLGDLKNELADLKREKADNEASKSMTQSQINSQNAKIKSAQDEVKQAEDDIEKAKNKINESNEHISKTKDESSKLLVFYEIMQGENSFIEYVSSASNMTDLVMRADAVSQILTYNQNKLKELEELIVENEELQVELKKKEEELQSKIQTYEKSVSSLKSDLSSLVKMALDIDSQIKAQQELIKYYEDIGCSDSQTLSACVNVVDNARWLRPTNKGYISSIFGWRSFYLNGVLRNDYHNGIDIAGNPGGTNIYPTANGTVAAIIRKASCGGNQVFIHARVQGKDYTIHFAHMLDIYVKVGQKVTVNDVVGTIGGGGATISRNGGWDTCSTGYHLHYNVATGFYLGSGYSSYSKYVANSFSAPGLPAYGNWYYSRY